MITYQEAKKLVEKELERIEKQSRIKVLLMEEHTTEFKYGWMFFYQSEEYIRTGDLGAMVGGNAPIIVDKYNASVHTTGTRREEEFYIEKYCQYRDDIEQFEKEIR